MALKRYCIILMVTLMVAMLPVGGRIVVAEECSPRFSPGLHTGWLIETYESGTYNRTFQYYIPSSYDGARAVPLLFSFHGLGSNPAGQIELTKFDALAEQEGFIAVFPQATALVPADYPACAQYLPALPGANIMWNLGLPWSLQYCAGIDDVGFVSRIIEWFKANYRIDGGRIYATGMSNGAMLSYYLALMLPGTFAGVAPVCSPMTVNGFEFEDVSPVTMVMIMGTTDPIVSYGGRPYAYGSMEDTVTFWLDANRIPTETRPAETVWGPTATDSTVVRRYVYSGGTNGTEVVFFKVERGGHTWPSGPLYSPFVGAVSSHVDGTALIWKHLPPKKYYLRLSSSLGGSVDTPGRKTFANVLSTGRYMFFNAGTGATVVNLEAVPDTADWEFVNWTGDIGTVANVTSARTTITIVPDRDYEITANFRVKPKEPEPEPEPEPKQPSGWLCFIATAAYGTDSAEKVEGLREFRDTVLLKSSLGSRLVGLYYRVSPPIADFISEHRLVRTLVTELLIEPIVLVVKAATGIR